MTANEIVTAILQDWAGRRDAAFDPKLVEAVERGVRPLLNTIAGEQEARFKCERALTNKDAAMGVLFERLRAAGIDCSDLIS